jgi:hypothetical protein
VGGGAVGNTMCVCVCAIPRYDSLRWCFFLYSEVSLRPQPSMYFSHTQHKHITEVIRILISMMDECVCTCM